MTDAWLESFDGAQGDAEPEIVLCECPDCGKLGVPSTNGYECPECTIILEPEHQDTCERPVEGKRFAPSIQVVGDAAHALKRKVDRYSAPDYRDTQTNELFRYLINLNEAYVANGVGRKAIPHSVLQAVVHKYQEVSKCIVIRSHNKKATLVILIYNTSASMGHLRYISDIAEMLQMNNARVSKGKSILHTLFSRDKISEDMNRQRDDMYIDAIFQALGLGEQAEVTPWKSARTVDPLYVRKLREFVIAMLATVRQFSLGISHMVLTTVAGVVCNVLVRVPTHPGLDWPNTFSAMALRMSTHISIKPTTIETFGKKFKAGKYHSKFLPIYRQFQADERPL